MELIDFQLEKAGDADFYSEVVRNWGTGDDYGLVGRCPACGRFVRYGLEDKTKVDDPQATGLPVLPDDWHQHAYIES